MFVSSQEMCIRAAQYCQAQGLGQGQHQMSKLYPKVGSVMGWPGERQGMPGERQVILGEIKNLLIKVR